MKVRLFLVALCLLPCLFLSAAKPIDVVIHCYSDEKDVLEECIEKVQQYVIGCNDIYVISARRFTKKARFIKESKLPFTLKKITERLKVGKKSSKELARLYFRELALQYVPLISTGLTDQVLTLSATTGFDQPFEPFSHEGLPFLDVIVEPFDQGIYAPYLNELIPPWSARIRNIRQVEELMIYDVPILKSMVRACEKKRKMFYWKAVVSAVKGAKFNTEVIGTKVSYLYHAATNYCDSFQMRVLEKESFVILSNDD